MPVSTNAIRPQFDPTRRRGAELRRSGSTERFFLEGDEQEANGFKTVALEADAELRSRPNDFDSFDRIPKRRWPLLVVAGLFTAFGVALVAGSVDLSTIRRLQNGVSVPSGTSALPAPGQSPATPQRVETTPDHPTVPVETPPVAADAGNTTPARQTHTRAKTFNREQVRARVRADLPVPLRGHVWSPTTGTLVPAEVAPPATNAAPIESSDSRSEPTPILD